MIRKPFIPPALHLIRLDHAQSGRKSHTPSGRNLSELSDPELAAILQQERILGHTHLYKASEGYAAREIAGETILVPVNDQAGAFNGMISFNPTGQFLWKLLQRNRTEGDLAYLLAKEYSKDLDEVALDVRSFLERAVKRGFVCICDSAA